ncbi:hypothetical protein [Cryobacterium roopkundense]|nr:hypothetical protein [Cryobacterium roopkundense]MBB5643263.1 hypothetical protein [Cryobacterium roopkundense]
MIVGVATGLLVTACAVEAPPTPTPSAPITTSEPTPSEPLPIVDSGALEGAMGTAETDEEGVMRYTVVEGDVGGIVCDRFGRAWWQLDNERNSGGFDCHSMINIGDVVTLTNDKKP